MQCPDLQDVPVPDPSASNAGGWALLVVLPIVVLLIDLYLHKTGRPTMSQWSKKNVKKHPWRMGIGLGLLVALIWHVAFGGPI